ncbi:MAG: DUF4097 family beta strand repeat-containing protein [Gemmatimonadota bacterium]
MAAPLPLTRGRRVALATGAPLALLVIAWTALSAVAWLGQGSYPVRLHLPARAGTATVRVDAGDVRVRPGTAGRLGVTGTAHYALVRSRVTWQTAPSGVSVISQCRQLAGPCGFDYTVTAPPGLATQVTSGSGDVTATGLAAAATLHSGSGTVRLWSLSGAVKATSGSGDITGSVLTGPAVNAEAGSGSITLSGVRSRDVTVSAGSGDITVTFASAPADVQVSAGSGDVRLVLPRGRTAYRVRTRADSGATAVTVPQDPASARVIVVTDGSGNITITH